MPNQYVTTTDFDALLTPTFREAAFVDAAGAYSAAIFNRAAQLASAMVQSNAANAGYSIPDDTDGTSTDDDMVKLATLAVLVPWAYERRQQEVPPSVSAKFDPIPEQLRVGALPLTTITPDPFGAVGGSKFSDSSSSGKPPVYGDLRDLL